MNLRLTKTIEERRNVLEKELETALPAIGNNILEDSSASEKNCENMIGAIQIPLGIAGPLKVNAKNYFIPLATTEGALVASVNRGCKAITESGGAHVSVKRIGVTRGPVFSIKTENEKILLEQYFVDHMEEIRNIAEQTSGHLKLLRIETQYEHPYEFVRFYFDTGEAMGMNMVTIGSHAIAGHIQKTLGIRCIAISGNFCVDKKPSLQNFRNGRGRWVTGEVTLPGEVLERVLKTTAKDFFEVWHAKCLVGSKITGIIGGNAQIANIIAALFVATGQDIAHITEGSMGVTTTEYTPGSDEVHVSVVLPDIMVGTVGGGTGLPTQKESLGILGISGGGNGERADELAGIVAGASLAGEISLIASLAQGSLGKAHESLARGKK